MEYKLVFDDGSSAYLAHHGVLGMKWGVRNAETRLKYQSGNGGLVKPSSGGGQGQTRGAGYSSGKNRSGLSEGQKRALKTAAVGLGTAAALGGAVYLARRGGLKKLNTARKTAVNAAKAEHQQTAKQLRNKELNTARMKARFATMGKTPNGRELSKADKALIGNKKAANRYMMAETRYSKEARRRANDVGWQASLSRMNMYNKIDKAGRSYKYGKAKIDRLTKIGALSAVGAGGGASAAYGFGSRKK